MPSVDYDPRRDADTDLFALLGTEWAADPAVVRRAWRTASQTAHPDAGGSHDAFIRMQHAWEVLADATRRTRYVRSYEARHGPQRRPSGRQGGSDGPRSRPRPTRSRRARSGPTAPRCTATTRQGARCANPAAAGSDRCRRHDSPADGPTSTGSGGNRSPAWRCDEFVLFQGTRLPCHHNRLIGENLCWDHATETQRRAALTRVRGGRCAALTQQGRPCRNLRSSMGFPLCIAHLTVGVFTSDDHRHEPDRRPPRTQRDRGRTAPPPPGPPRSPTPPPTAPAGAAPPPGPPRSPTPPPTAPAGAAPPPGGTPSPGSPPSPRPSYARPRRRPPTVPRRRSRHRVVGAAATVSLALVVAAVAGIAHWWSQPRAIGFAEDIKATSATCSSDEPIAADDVLRGFDLTCTVVDDAPGNSDRPYLQARLDGCDDWQRLDHDDGPAAVTISTRLAPCGTDPAVLEWQVCQTHGGLLPDDCDDGTTDLPSR